MHISKFCHETTALDWSIVNILVVQSLSAHVSDTFRAKFIDLLHMKDEDYKYLTKLLPSAVNPDIATPKWSSIFCSFR